MVIVREAHLNEIPLFMEMEQNTEAKGYVTVDPLSVHQEHFHSAEFVYLTILDDDDIAGFCILALDPDEVSIEFRRIVVGKKDRGIGQAAIEAMEDYCKATIQRNRIWLDVYEDNDRGRHIYEKLDYVQFNQSEQNGRTLLFYNKQLG